MSVPIPGFRSPVHLEYEITPGRALTRFLRGMTEGRILAQRCPECSKVYVPPKGACATCGVPTEEELELSGRGTVTTFCVVRLPYEGMKIEVPFVCAHILLDGADLPLFHIIQEIPADEVRMGLRVEASWKPEQERGPSFESIRHFRPTGEADVPYEQFREHL